MNFDKKTFPDFVLANLYKETVVVFNNQPKLAKINEQNNNNNLNEPNKQINFLGQNSKNIAIVVQQDNVVHMHDEDFAFLSNILAACKLNVADVAIINISKQVISFQQLKQQLNTKQIILFNLDTQQIGLPFSIPNYQVQNYDGCSIITTKDFTAMLPATQEAKVEKTKLWTSLKQMFSL